MNTNQSTKWGIIRDSLTGIDYCRVHGSPKKILAFLRHLREEDEAHKGLLLVFVEENPPAAAGVYRSLGE